MIKRKPQGEARKPKFPKRLCKQCGTEFQALRKWHEFCSRNCRVMSWKNSNTDPEKVADHERRISILEKKLAVVEK
jgi:hypothetical protein